MKLKIQKIPWFLTWKGLLFEKTHPIVFHTRFGIHTFGMRYPIDVIIADKKNVIQKIKLRLQPNKLFFWNPLFNTVVELPAGTVKSEKLKIGEKLDL